MFRIVTDTSANLPTDYLLSEQITIIPYTFQSGKGEQSCMDLATFDAKDFYTQMRSGVKVTTSQIPPQRYIDVLTPMLEAGEDVLFVSMSSGISGSYASGQIAARQLREEFPDRKLLLVDTYSASLGEGLLVMRAVNCRREGMCIDETYKTLRALRHRMAQIFTVDDLRYLRRTGRLSNLEAAVGTVLQIKPLLKGDPQGKSSVSPSFADGSVPSRPLPSGMRNLLWMRRTRPSASPTPTARPTRRSSRPSCAAAASRPRIS